MEEETGDRTGRPSPGVVLTAVGITAFFGLIVYFIFLGKACDHYEQTHVMRVWTENGWFGRTYQVQEHADFSMLSWSGYVFTVLAPTVLYICVHPLLGKLGVVIWNLLAGELADALGIGNNELDITSPGDVIIGSLWPIFLLLIPLELIALLIATVYRAVWD